MPFIEEILNTIQTIICDLQPQQVMLLFVYICMAKFWYSILIMLCKYWDFFVLLQIHTFYEAVGYMISAQSVGEHMCMHSINYNFSWPDFPFTTISRSAKRPLVFGNTQNVFYFLIIKCSMHFTFFAGLCCTRKVNWKVHVLTEPRLGQHHQRCDKGM